MLPLKDLFLNLIFPPKCIFCGVTLGHDAVVEACDQCRAGVVASHRKDIPPEELDVEKAWCDRAMVAFEYDGPIRECIMNFKYHDKPSYGRTLGQMLIAAISGNLDMSRFDLVMGIPLHKSRMKERGYNQSELMANSIAALTGLPRGTGLVERVRNTSSQSLLTREQRRENMAAAFRVNRLDKVRGKSILLVDDVLTTGSTLNECSRVLKEAGAKEVVAVALASRRSDQAD